MKKLIPILIILVVLVIAAIFLLKGCEPRTKEDEILEVIEETISKNTTAEAEIEDSAENYHNAFINANVAMTCLLYTNSALKNNDSQISLNVEKVYAQHGLPVSNDALMIQILQKYEDDKATIDTITKNAERCRENEEGVYL